MTTKKVQILRAGLQLFATEGYTATSTNKIAVRADVSEGLIFRHFHSKEGLLEAIIAEGESAFHELYADILDETNPKAVIRRVINLPLNIPEEHYEFWRLQHRLKWELSLYNPEKSLPLLQKLARSFKMLGYHQPEDEAVFLSDYLEGLAGQILLGRPVNKEATRSFLLSKYSLSE